jgi:class 3 adenylate cyclase
MTETADLLSMEEKYILIFDICSSTKIVEQLILENHQERWRNLIIDIKEFLREESDAIGFKIYKFMGDGWILLFSTDLSPSILFNFVDRLCKYYAIAYHERIGKILSTHIDKVGVTFGLEVGDVISFVMLDQTEYIGRPLIIAARLQGALQDNDTNPQGKMLMSRGVYDKVRKHIPKTHKVWKVTRELKNVLGGGEYHALKYEKR